MAGNHQTSLATSCSIATAVREENLVMRRLGMNLRFIRRFRLGSVCPKTASEIILNEEMTPHVLYRLKSTKSSDSGIAIWFMLRDRSLSSATMEHSVDALRHTSLSRATPSVGTGFHSCFCSCSFPTKIGYAFNTLHYDRFNCTAEVQCHRLFTNGFDGFV